MTEFVRVAPTQWQRVFSTMRCYAPALVHGATRTSQNEQGCKKSAVAWLATISVAASVPYDVWYLAEFVLYAVVLTSSGVSSN